MTFVDARSLLSTSRDVDAFLPYSPFSVGRFSTKETGYILQRDDKRIDMWRIELRPGDFVEATETTSNAKSEIQTLRSYKNPAFNGCAPYGVDMWQAWSVKLEPRPPFMGDFCILGQWHATEDNPETAPARVADDSWYPVAGFTLGRVQDSLGDVLQYFTRYSSAERQPQGTSNLINYNVSDGPLTRGVWHHIVVRINFAYTGNTGSLQVWLNGQEKVNVSGVNIGYNDLKGPHFNWGIYRGYRDSDPYPEIIYYANMEGPTQTSLAHLIGNPRPL